MKLTRYIAGTLLLLGLFSCEKKWEEHYNSDPETVNMNVWDAIQQNPDLSLFAQYVKEFKYDTLFLSDNAYSLFIPDNNAMTALTDTGTVTASMLDYHISLHFIQSRNVQGLKRIQTLAEKFAFFENTGSELYFDEITIQVESPLYLNGKYFVIDQVALPKPNLYEYFYVENPVLTAFIDSHDSIILDKELSRPIGFDEYGNTVYDTVSEIYNLFEEKYFPVSKELRSKTATFVFPREEDYNNALTEMALALGESYQDYNDIPIDWQFDVLIPYILDHGVFENLIEPSEFIPPPPPDTLKMKNILGDSVYVEYEPVDQAFCSNGFAYNYADFAVPDTLFTGGQRIEGEWLLQQVGANKFAWLEEVNLVSDASYEPLREFGADASNDSIVRVPFQLGYTGTYELEFNVDKLFPRKYLMVVRTHMYVGGIYDIYVNDELVAEIDYYDYVRGRELWKSVTGIRYKPEGGYNRFDCWVQNNAPYGEMKVKFVYKEPGNVQSNGLVIDYIDFVPYDD
jgi:hypothetical protein